MIDLLCDCCKTKLSYGDLASTANLQIVGKKLGLYSRPSFDFGPLVFICAGCTQSGLAVFRGYKITKIGGRIVDTGIGEK